MQISRHWRMNSQRYRLEGVRYQNGEVSLQSRPAGTDDDRNGRQASQPERETRSTPAVSVA
jgi:hypothetical protein